MKIRNGFVSNSSSTAFTFVFKKDTVEDVANLVRKYNQFFELHWDEHSCTAEEVATAIEQAGVQVVSLEKLIELISADAQRYLEMSRAEEGGRWAGVLIILMLFMSALK